VARPPLPHSHWLEPDRILAGEHPWGGSDEATAERVQKLLDAGVDCFFDLTEPGELDSYEKFLRPAAGGRDIVYLQKPIYDHCIPESPRHMQEILDALDAVLADGRRVYIHCRAGIGRTNLVAGCWFASRGGGGEAALERLNRSWRANARSRRWPSVPETEEQVEFVRGWPPVLQPQPPPDARPEPPSTVADPGLRDRIRGMLLGLAAADALGHAVYGLPSGAWSDKTAMALCLAESYVVRRGHDAADQVSRYHAWQRSGRWSSTGSSVGASAATAKAIATAQWTGNPYAGSHDPAHADAEPLARIGAAVAWNVGDPGRAIEAAVNAARVTHQAPLTLDAARLYAALLAGALAGAEKSALLAPNFTPAAGAWDPAALRPPLDEIAAGAWRGRRPRLMLRGKFLAAAAIESSLAAFESGGDFAACVQEATSRPGDAPTVAAMVGQLAGAHYGVAAIPAAWRSGLARSEEIESLADSLARR
jgi:ADP-ribosylglycohydrolase